MPVLDDWEPWAQQLVNEIQGWLHSRDKNIDITPRKNREDTRLGQIWRGRRKKVNIVCYNRLQNGFRIELLLNRNLSNQLERELRNAGLVARYTDDNRRLNIPLTATEYERHNQLLQRFVRMTYEQAIRPLSQSRRGI